MNKLLPFLPIITASLVVGFFHGYGWGITYWHPSTNHIFHWSIIGG